VRLLLLYAYVAVIVQLPPPTAVIKPPDDTVATFVFEDSHVTSYVIPTFVSVYAFRPRPAPTPLSVKEERDELPGQNILIDVTPDAPPPPPPPPPITGAFTTVISNVSVNVLPSDT